MQRLFSVLAEAHGAGASHGRNETTARFRRGSVRRMFFKSTASASCRTWKRSDPPFIVAALRTNSSNLGKNLMSKYSRADVFTMNEKELELARPAYQFEAKSALEDMAKHLGGSGLLTVGAAGAVGYYEGEFYECPAFTLNITDTVGAGDAFFSLCALAAALKAPMKLTTFMGSVAGAIASNIIGNKEFISRVNYLKFAQTLMNY